MKQYLSFFRMRFVASLQYRAAAWAGIATQFFWGAMELMIYSAFYASSSGIMPMEYSHLSDYIWLRQGFLMLLMLWYRDGEIFDMITSGSVAYELCRPYSLYTFWYIRLLANRLSGASLRCVPLFIFAALLPAPYGLSLPPNLPAFLVFLLSLTLGVGIVISLSMLIYVLTFITLSPAGSMLMVSALSEFASGALLPIPFMPDVLQKALQFLPFSYTVDLPLRLYSGDIPIQGALSGIAIQAFWLCLLIALGAYSMKKVMRKVVLQGG